MTEDKPPPRPSSTEPRELGFRIHHSMVRWLSPTLLVDTAARVFFASIFGSYSDKREIEAALPTWAPPSYANEGELWIDYVADVGDGFGPTYSMASLLAAETLDVTGPDGASVATRRGRILVMGGDQVYPTASIENYEDRTLGPYRASLPYLAEDNPHLYAVPGNHDWYDGLTSFLRIFCRQQWIGGRKTQQCRSYFALELCAPWWMWGIDVQLDAYVDEPQLAYFREAAKKLRAGDLIVLCSALPSWVRANEDEPEAYAKLDYFERTIIEPTKARVVLSLTGDAHHYAHYVAADGTRHKITAGGGGAYSSATHHLPGELLLPPPASRDQGKTEPAATYALQTTFPDARWSRWRRLGAVTLPFKNLSFWALVGVIHLLYLWFTQSALHTEEQAFEEIMRDNSLGDIGAALARSPLAWVVAVIVVWGCAAFTRKHVWWKQAVGAAHGVAQLSASVFSISFSARILSEVTDPVWYTVGFIALVGIGGGLLGSWVMAVYLAVADVVKVNYNELFAAQRIRGYKCFLRLHIDPRGVLTVYPVGLRRTCRRWELRHGGEPQDPWFIPKTPLAPELIEPPFRLHPPKEPV